MNKDNVILIGMPGCGKSTIGVVLAKTMGYDFLDSDIVIQKVKNATLEQLIEEHGTDGFNEIENEVNSNLDIHKTVLATGGSVVYGKEAMNHLLEQLIEEHGTDGFNEIENEVNSNLDIHKTVLATGGSVVYGKEAMNHLKEIGTIVFIKLDCDEIASRLGDFKKRGISIKEGQTLLDLFNERKPLYEKYADVVVDTTGLDIKGAMAKIKASVEKEYK